MANFGLIGSLLIAMGLLVILASALTPLVEKLLFRLGDSHTGEQDKARHKAVRDRLQLLAKRESELTKTADLRLEELIHAGELEQALLLARERLHEMHLQGRAEPEELYRHYIAELEERLGSGAG